MTLNTKFSNHFIDRFDIIHEVNAFTDDSENALGNPAGVMITSQYVSEKFMAEMAKCAELPMTAFLTPNDDTYQHFRLRYYDLTGRECHICGHATVAATEVLRSALPKLNNCTLTFDLNPKQFEGQERSIQTHVRDSKIAIDLFPSKLTTCDDDEALIERISDALKVNPEDIVSVSFATEVRDFVVGLKDRDTLMNLRPDFEALYDMAAEEPYQHEGMMVSAYTAEDNSRYDLNVRVFLPITGVNEDVACGSGNCSIIPYWHARGYGQDSGQFTAIFPYPEGDENKIGGVQDIEYSPAQDRISIVAQASYVKAIDVFNAYRRLNAEASNITPDAGNKEPKAE